MIFNILFRSYDFSNTYLSIRTYNFSITLLFKQITFLTLVIRQYDLRKHDIQRHDPLPRILAILDYL
jgi:hypothetical protein